MEERKKAGINHLPTPLTKDAIEVFSTYDSRRERKTGVAETTITGDPDGQ